MHTQRIRNDFIYKYPNCICCPPSNHADLHPLRISIFNLTYAHHRSNVKLNLISCKNNFELHALRPGESLHVPSDVFLAEITVAPFLAIVTGTKLGTLENLIISLKAKASEPYILFFCNMLCNHMSGGDILSHILPSLTSFSLVYPKFVLTLS